MKNSVNVNMELSDSDEAPEGISFKSSKEEVLDVFQKIKNSLNNDKLLKKQQRQTIEQRNIIQKKRKLLDADFLDEIDDALEENAIREVTQKSAEKKRLIEDVLLKPTIKPDTDETEIFIPLKNTQRYVKKVDGDAANFKQSTLYRVQTKRVNAASLKSFKAKRLARQR